MITRLLRRFCSPEVEMLLKHLEEHPEDFKKTTGYGQWERLADEVYTHGTFIEQRVLTDVKKKVFKDYARKQMLGAIVKQTINPAPDVTEDDEYSQLSQQYSKQLAQSMVNTQNVISTGLMNSQFQNQAYQGLLGVGVGNPTQLATQQQLLNQYKNATNQP